jgi:tripartite-type tricarboxylate transporter receptor subunit TctC
MRQPKTAFKTILCASALAAVSLALPKGAMAQEDTFYKGKTINLLSHSAVGGSAGFYVRLIARYMPEHIAGKPNMIAQEMPGGGGKRLSNFLYNVAPKDGTSIGALNQTLGLDQILSDGAEYDTSKFNWIGRLAATTGLVMIYHTAPATTIEEMKTKEIIFAGSGKASQAYMIPTLMRNVLGLKTKVVIGYNGSGAIYLAMERGEVHARTGAVETILASHPDWLEKGIIKTPAELTLEDEPSLPGVISLRSLAKTDADRDILDLIASYTAIGIGYAAPPGLPPARVATLRRAFDATMKDERLLADIEKSKMELSTATGEHLQDVTKMFAHVSPELLERTKKALEW